MENNNPKTNVGTHQVILRSFPSLFWSSIVILVLASIYWIPQGWIGNLPVTLPNWAVPGAALLVTGVLSFRLGRQSHELGIHPGQASMGVSWRLGFIWVILSGLSEYVWTTLDASISIAEFPTIFIPTVIVGSVSVLCGYFFQAFRSTGISLSDVERQDVYQVFLIVVAVLTLLVSMFR